MNIGLCEKDLRGDLDANLDWMAANGLMGAQLWLSRLNGLSAAEVRRRVADRGMTITSFGGGPNMVDASVARDTREAFRKIFDFAAELDCHIVCAESKSRPQDMPESEAWTAVVDTVGVLCEHAASVGSVLAVECSGPCFIRDHNMWLELARHVDSPALKVNYDPANIVWAERDPVEGVRVLAEHIVHTHAKDIARVLPADADAADIESQEHLQDVPAGEGLVGFRDYLAALKAVGYDGWHVIEMHAGAEGRPDDILKAAANLRALADELDL